MFLEWKDGMPALRRRFAHVNDRRQPQAGQIPSGLEISVASVKVTTPARTMIAVTAEEAK